MPGSVEDATVIVERGKSVGQSRAGTWVALLRADIVLSRRLLGGVGDPETHVLARYIFVQREPAYTFVCECINHGCSVVLAETKQIWPSKDGALEL